MNIKINNKKYNIKSSHDLTVSEYFNLLQQPTGLSVMAYLNVVTGSDFKDINNFNGKGRELSILNTWIGKIKTLEYFKRNAKPQDTFVFENSLIDLKESFEITLGLRSMYEAFVSEKRYNFEAALYLVAIIVNNQINKSKKYDFESTQIVYDKLLNHNYIEVLPSALFFLKKLTAIYNKEMRFLKVLKWVETLKSKMLISRRVVKG